MRSVNTAWLNVVSVLFSLVVTALALARPVTRAVVANANFFTYRYEVVLAERKRRLDIAEHLRHIGEEEAADQQVAIANEAVARACALSRMSPARTGRNTAGTVVYATGVGSAVMLGMSLLAAWIGQPQQALSLSIIGALMLLGGFVPAALILSYLTDKGDKQARVVAVERARQYPNPTTYPVTGGDAAASGDRPA